MEPNEKMVAVAAASSLLWQLNRPEKGLVTDVLRRAFIRKVARQLNELLENTLGERDAIRLRFKCAKRNPKL
jgi:hypothetical protein